MIYVQLKGIRLLSAILPSYGASKIWLEISAAYAEEMSDTGKNPIYKNNDRHIGLGFFILLTNLCFFQEFILTKLEHFDSTRYPHSQMQTVEIRRLYINFVSFNAYNLISFKLIY